jgi:hypothetical protein
VKAPPNVIDNIPYPQTGRNTEPRLTPADIKKLKDGAVTLQPPKPAPSPPQPVQTAPIFVPPSGSTISSQPNSSGRTLTAMPGGISLSQAAAERLPLNFELDSAFIADGRIILSGRKTSSGSIDAALFLTALRATCENSDPYFSLDPDNVASWVAETQQAVAELNAAIKNDVTWHIKGVRAGSPSVLSFRTILASRDYPGVWNSILARHQNLRSRLVFSPEWLRQTRFGQIMYRADVLLKELAGGATSLGSARLRAAAIADYRSATERMAATQLLYKYSGLMNVESPHANGRIWYDLTETSSAASSLPRAIVAVGNSELRTMLARRGLIDIPVAQRTQGMLTENAGALDLSGIYPRMYVRVRDPVANRDTSANFAGLDELVIQANNEPAQYAAAYSEYESLVEVFRAYVVAVRAKALRPWICAGLPHDLLDSEKTSAPLPAYHPTDFTMTMGWYEYTDGRMRRAIGMSGGLFQGGVSIGAARFVDSALVSNSNTAIIRTLITEVAKPVTVNQAVWKDDAGRQYFALTFDQPAPSAPRSALSAPIYANSAPPTAWGGGAPVHGTGNGTSSRINPSPQRMDQPRLAQATRTASPAAAQRPADSAAGAFAVLLGVVAVFAFLSLPFLLPVLSPHYRPVATGPIAAGAGYAGGVIAMPDRSSSDSEPYVAPSQRDAMWRSRVAANARQAQTNARAAAEAKSSAYDAAERGFHNVFAMKSRFDREHMVKDWQKVHGGSREDAMMRLVENWQRDNRSWR